MAQRRKKERDEVPVVRRGDAPRRRLAPDLEEIARGDADFVRSRPPRPRLNDPRPVALVAGVANRDARLVFEARVEAMQALREDEAALGPLLAEALWLGLWRCRSVTSFDALVEEMLELPADQARGLAEVACHAAGLPAEPLSEELVAVWLRSEAALLELGEGRVFVRPADADTLTLRLSVSAASTALEAIGRRMAPLASDRRGPSGPRR
ncbi:MAG: hypothetical protein H6721_29665 [Sandaracinus sp.]|nr:hypothetical protein [Sandaracinus sp.]MCB9623588.1 hypothetical protein [Sandaracinus sp.]MCB9636300.1 hypothetical protein [Sandaracinus sp.]